MSELAAHRVVRTTHSRSQSQWLMRKPVPSRKVSRDLPQAWGKDKLSEFMDQAERNTIATFANLQPEYERLKVIDDIFFALADNQSRPGVLLAPLMLMRAHSAFRGAVRLALGTQVAEAYPVLRGCIECGFYAFKFSSDKESSDVWLNRHENRNALKRAKKCFRLRPILELLKSVDERKGTVLANLYQRTIDYGGHPNEQGFFSMMKMHADEKKIEFNLEYMCGDSAALKLCLKTIAQVGVATLDVFRLISMERFDILGLREKLDEARRGL